jgi:hypothetical protein
LATQYDAAAHADGDSTPHAGRQAVAAATHKQLTSPAHGTGAAYAVSQAAPGAGAAVAPGATLVAGAVVTSTQMSLPPTPPAITQAHSLRASHGACLKRNGQRRTQIIEVRSAPVISGTDLHCDMASHSPRVYTVSQPGTHAAVVAFHMQAAAAEHGATPVRALHVAGAAVVGTALVAAGDGFVVSGTTAVCGA